MKTQIRNILAKLSRSLPPLKGKTKLGLSLLPLLTNYHSDQDCLVKIKMRRGNYMEIDLRSKCEQKSFFTGEYDDGVIQKLATFLSPGESVLDVGANIGFYAIALGLALQEKGGVGKVYAIEPVLANYQRLKRMIQINGLGHVVHPFNTALGDREGTVKFEVEAQNGATTGNAAWIKEGNITVREANCTCSIMRLDQFVKEQNIHTCCLIKVDAEGAERDILAGGKTFIMKTKPIIFSEFNPYCAREFGYSFQDLQADMTALHYSPYILKSHHLLPLYEHPTSITNIFWIPEEKLDLIMT